MVFGHISLLDTYLLTYLGYFQAKGKCIPVNMIECGGTGVRVAVANSISMISWCCTSVVKARSAYVASAKYIIHKVQLTSSWLLKQLTCLQRANRKKSSSFGYIAKLCDALPLSIRSDRLKDECKPCRYKSHNLKWTSVINLRNIGKTWSTLRVVMATKVSQCFHGCQSLSHLSHVFADVERWFSRYGCILTETIFLCHWRC